MDDGGKRIGEGGHQKAIVELIDAQLEAQDGNGDGFLFAVAVEEVGAEKPHGHCE